MTHATPRSSPTTWATTSATALAWRPTCSRRYVVTIVATMLLGAIFFADTVRDWILMLPLGIGGICILASIVGTYFVRLGPDTRHHESPLQGGSW